MAIVAETDNSSVGAAEESTLWHQAPPYSDKMAAMVEKFGDETYQHLLH